MTTPANTFTLKTRQFHPPLVITWDGEVPPDILDRTLLVWGADVDNVVRFEGFQDASRRAVGKALTEALRIARDIRKTPGGVIRDHDHQGYAERIAALATAYGSLWGDIPGKPDTQDRASRLVQGTLKEWYSELLDLLDAEELKTAIVGKRENRSFRKRLAYDETGELVFYLLNSHRSLFLASKGQTITIERPGKAPYTLDMWNAAQGTSDTFAWATLSTLLEKKLNGHVNIGLHPFDMTSIAITPSGILPTLFARVWLNALTGADTGDARLVRTCDYPGCDEELSADPRQRYCSDAHRKADKRRLQRLSRAQS